MLSKFKVTFLPDQITCEALEGESILDVALNHDIPLQHACGGFCSCTTCHVLVIQGESSLSKVEVEEEERLGSVDGPSNSRLGCQAKVRGDVTVQIMNRDV